MSTETIMIVGAGQAGGWAAHALRKEGFAGRVVLLGEEPHPPHERPPLSKAVLAGEAVPESTHLFKSDAFAQLNVDWRPGVRVTAIDRGAKVAQGLHCGHVPFQHRGDVRCMGSLRHPQRLVQEHLIRGPVQAGATSNASSRA
jgi:2-polyprenyl-6-methoxyphenol hydroxylase-like FAD-dependent oxidoreductase